MGLGDELRARANAQSELERLYAQGREGQQKRERSIRDTWLRQIHQFTREANQTLLDEGVKPSSLKSTRPPSRWFYSIGKILPDLDHGHGWLLPDGLVVDLNGHLWGGRRLNISSKPGLKTDYILVGQGGPDYLPFGLKQDNLGLYLDGRDGLSETYYRKDFMEILTNGYAAVLKNHHS